MDKDEFIFAEFAKEQMRQQNRQVYKPNVANMKLPIQQQLYMLELEKTAVEMQIDILNKILDEAKK